MNIRFGVSPIAWANDDMPELGGDTPLDKILEDIQALGFDGVELGGKFPRDYKVLNPMLASFDLSLVGGWYSGALLTRNASDEIVAIQPHLELLKAMGSEVFVFAEISNAVHGRRDCTLRDAPRLAPDDWPRFGEQLTGVAEYIRDQGLRFAYHHHMGTVVERAEDLRAFIANTGDAVGLTLDTGHAALGGIDCVSVIEQYPERIAHVHCKDVRWRVFTDTLKSGGSFLDGVLAGMFTVPGDGGLNFPDIIRALDRVGYQGWIIIEAEQDPAIADPRKYAKIGLQTLQSLTSGLKVTP